MNVPLLRKIQQTILAEPKRLKMSRWLGTVREGKDNPNCSTVGCIAGWAAVLTAPKGQTIKDTAKKVIRVHGAHNVEDMGREALGLTYEQAVRLFHVWEWPGRHQEAYEEAKTPEARATVTVDRIDKFIACKGAR